MALPTNRDITLGPADPVPSALLNKLQDQSIGMKKPSFWRSQVPSKGWVETNIVFDTAGTYGTGQIQATGVAAKHCCPCTIDLLPGDRITGIGMRIFGTGGAQTVTAILERAAQGDVVGVGMTVSAVNPAAAWTTYTQILNSPYVVGATGLDEAFWWKIDLPLLNTKLALVSVQIDRL